MIISRTPVRIPLGGGGTDLPAYYEKYEGSVLTAAVSKYVYIVVKQHFEETIRVTGYSRKEVVESPDQVQHPVVREALKLLGLGRGIEIVSISDVPANTGLGTSSSFAVGLLNALHAFKSENPSPQTLAQEALHIERVLLKEAGGVQDQYIAAYGGFLAIHVNKQGEVAVSPLRTDTDLLAELERRLVFFYTRFQRSASAIQAEHVQSLSHGAHEAVESLHEIKRIGMETREAFEHGELDRFGRLLDAHWNCKKRIGANISNGEIDRWYGMALEAGALGGKLVGAGGGGFLMLYCHPDARDRVRAILSKDLKELRVRFEASGSRILLNI